MDNKDSDGLDLNEREKALKKFILNDRRFYDLAKKFTFLYREFSPYIDFCQIKWNRKEKVWEFEGYFRFNQDEKFPQKKAKNKNLHFLNLSIDPVYSWGSLFSKMEEEFVSNLSLIKNEEEIDEFIQNDYDSYLSLRDSFFVQQKDRIINDWFKMDEKLIEDYIYREVINLNARDFID